MTKAEEALKGLQEHASGTVECDGFGLADVLWRHQDSPEEVDLDPVWDDLARLLQMLQPSLTTLEQPESDWRSNGIPIAYVDAVAEITSNATLVAFSAPSDQLRQDGARLAWRVSMAWAALTAGDFADIRAHVEAEEWALDLGQ